MTVNQIKTLWMQNNAMTYTHTWACVCVHVYVYVYDAHAWISWYSPSSPSAHYAICNWCDRNSITQVSAKVAWLMFRNVRSSSGVLIVIKQYTRPKLSKMHAAPDVQLAQTPHVSIVSFLSQTLRFTQSQCICEKTNASETIWPLHSIDYIRNAYLSCVVWLLWPFRPYIERMLSPFRPYWGKSFEFEDVHAAVVCKTMN